MKIFHAFFASVASGLLLLGGASAAAGQVVPLPTGFRVQEIKTNGTSLHVRIGGKGPAVLLQHGYGETGDMWAALAAKLAVDHLVIIPDLRGMGLSPITKGGYDKKTQGHDLAGVLDALKVQQVDLVTHDIGNMVGYAFAAEYPTRVRRFVLIDAPLPGIGNWDETRLDHHTWHFSFWGPDEDRLVAGRERIWLDRFYNELSFNPKTINEGVRAHYAAIYAKPGRMHAAFEQFRAFDQDAIDDKAFVAKGKLTMPVLAVGGDHSFGPKMAAVMRIAASNVTEGIIPNSGHWIMEENPTATIALVTSFLAK
jgi:pimeloyl-ACP methyl ester carboxylesterase